MNKTANCRETKANRFAAIMYAGGVVQNRLHSKTSTAEKLRLPSV